MTAAERKATGEGGLSAGLIEAALRYWWLIAVAGTVFGVLTFFLVSLQEPVYRADARLVLGSPEGVFTEVSRTVRDSERHLVRQVERITSRDVLVAASERLEGRFSADALGESIEALEYPGLDVIELTGSAPDPQDAADKANAVGQAYQEVIAAEVRETARTAIVELDQARQQARNQLVNLQSRLDLEPGDSALQAEFEVAQQQLQQISARSQQLAVDAALYGSGVEVFEPAEPRPAPDAPRPARSAIVAAVLGMLAAGALGWWRTDRHQVAESSAKVAELLGAPLLGEVPKFKGRKFGKARPLLSSLDPWAQEAYQFVLASLYLALRDVDGRSVAITGVAPGDGKTVTAMNVAFAAAEDGSTVAIVDGDERARGLTERMGMARSVGVSDIVAQKVTLAACTEGRRIPGSQKAVRIIPAGREVGNIPGLFRRPQYSAMLQRLREESDLLLVDTPPILAVSDALQTARFTDGIVLVVTRKTSMSLLNETRTRLDLVGTPILGFVLNRAKGGNRSSVYNRYYRQPQQPRQPKTFSSGSNVG